MGTRFDARNDPSWHFKNKQVFRVATIATTGEEIAEVASLNDLHLFDSDGNAVTQDRLDEHMAYLNGDRAIGKFSAMSSMHRRNQGQRSLSRRQERRQEVGENNPVTLEESRDRRAILDRIDRQLLQVNFLTLWL